ncbi:MAG TPA: methyltransferase domain-containing protein [Anaerolineaceae bacterium]
MQAYGVGFARIYNLLWTAFAQRAAPLLRSYYENQPISTCSLNMLDICCGSGQLARHFLEHGYRVVGIDLSEPMLEHARMNNADYIAAGQARFFQADAACFQVDEKFGLAVSTFDALNHLPDLSALQGCFRSTWEALYLGGMFIFDLNTALGLRRWNSINVTDTEEFMVVNRGIYDASGKRAVVHISGFFRRENGLYERFEETAFNTVFELAGVAEALRSAGYSAVRFCRLQDLAGQVEQPEQEERIWIVAVK